MATSTSLTQSKKVGLTAFLTKDAVRDQINKVVGGKDGQRFVTAIISAVNANPQLQECDNSSILSCALLGESLKLSPSPQLGHYYLLPFNDKNRGKVAQFVLGYKGYIQLAIRSGQYKKLNVEALKEGELISYDPLTEDLEYKLIEDPVERERAATTGYFAFFEYTNGFRKSLYWSKEKMEAHAIKYSPGYKAKKGYTFWEKDFDSMAKKTMLRQLISKWGIMSTEFQTAYEADLNTVNADGSVQYVETDDADIYEAAAEVQETAAEQTASVKVEVPAPEAPKEAGF